ncbi:nucleotide sugar dehydrogenase [uncultured Prochlorococcus sp.]|uniref:nucleotide sugar dehydrogenase n=1 Tax=uncultured Prochlorococcus sp. TaxID=159733 RepID=UPI00258A094E|nr:nucleotide sugar dehydrogenase [uncultured Prochlorococcus sp.]
MKRLNLPPLNKCSVAVIGLGYVGLPLAIAIANQKRCILSNKKIQRNVIGFDLDISRIIELKKGFDRNKISSKNTKKHLKNIKFTNDKKLLKKVDVFIITVPTPIDKKNNPNSSFIKEASKLVGESIRSSEQNKLNKIIIYESTVYPGLTEEICVPIIEQNSGLIYNNPKNERTFFCGYSPERINPGDSNHTINTIIKVTSGCNKYVASWIDEFYGSFIKAGTYKVSSIKVAEAAKIIENIQRDINIALVNELSMLFKKIEIDTQEVLEAANTKWNFHKYRPGLVGGHCIGVDPYYLTFKAQEIGFETKLISAGRSINNYMYEYLFQEIVNLLNKQNEDANDIKILLLGITYKSNCSDMRNSQLVLLAEKIKKRDLEITIVDPKVDRKKALEEMSLEILLKIPKNKKFSIIIFGLFHEEFNHLSYDVLKKSTKKNAVIIDLTNKIIGENVIHL